MSFVPCKSELPPSVLGDDRCFQIEYYGHGDIFAATWNGDISHNPSVRDDVATCFNFAHGNDVVIFASLAGYLRRVGWSQGDVKQVLSEAGQEILEDDPNNIRHFRRLDESLNERIAEGKRIPRFDIADPELHCLVIPIPSRPGVVDVEGGTGIYTRPNASGEDTYVFAGIKGQASCDLTDLDRIDRTADFCVEDVPVVARLVCEMALGEYRRAIQSFLINLYAQDN